MVCINTYSLVKRVCVEYASYTLSAKFADGDGEANFNVGVSRAGETNPTMTNITESEAVDGAGEAKNVTELQVTDGAGGANLVAESSGEGETGGAKSEAAKLEAAKRR